MLKIIKTIIEVIKIFPEKKKRLPGPILSMLISNVVSLIIPLLIMKVMDSLKNSEKIEATAPIAANTRCPVISINIIDANINKAIIS